MEEVELRQQIQDLDRQEQELEWELLDALTDISSPENSDNEEDEDNNFNEENGIVRFFKNAILSAQGQPTRVCDFLQRYEDPQYRRRVSRKMKKIKNEVKRSNIEGVLENPQYLRELERIRSVYPDHGGRELLNELIAVYIVLGN